MSIRDAHLERRHLSSSGVRTVVISCVCSGLLLILAARMEAADSPQVKPAIRYGVLVLKNDRIEFGVVPTYGAWVVLLRRPGASNIFGVPIKESPGTIPALECDDPEALLAHRGHTVWLAPQSEWWTNQDTDAEKKAKKATWPPDPTIVRSVYRPVESSATRLVLVSPDSRISGVRVTKMFELAPDGKITITTTLRNSRGRPVSWAVWSKTRLPGESRCEVPLLPGTVPNQAVRLETPSATDKMKVPLAVSVNGGRFRFEDGVIPVGRTARTSKAFIMKAERVVSASFGGQRFTKRALSQSLDAGPVPPGNAPVEVTQWIDINPANSFLEMDIVGSLVTMSPNGEVVFKEEWELVKQIDPAPADE